MKNFQNKHLKKLDRLQKKRKNKLKKIDESKEKDEVTNTGESSVKNAEEHQKPGKDIP